jgi:hypothetical protein
VEEEARPERPALQRLRSTVIRAAPLEAFGLMTCPSRVEIDRHWSHALIAGSCKTSGMKDPELKDKAGSWRDKAVAWTPGTKSNYEELIYFRAEAEGLMRPIALMPNGAAAFAH